MTQDSADDRDTSLDTVLGLSMTPTGVGWVLVEGQDAGGATLDHDDFEVHARRGVRAVNACEHATAAVLRTREKSATHGQRLHAISVTWSDDAAADAALTLESLTQAGFDNVIPVRFFQATETLARHIGPVIGYEKAAVCVIEPNSATVVMVDGFDGAAQTEVRHAPAGDDGLVWWLTTVCDRDDWQPDALVVVGSDDELDAIVCQLEKGLPVPVFGQAGTELALARAAALASVQSAVFAGVNVSQPPDDRVGGHARSRPLSYAGALTMLVAGVLTFVTSLSLAVGLQLTPERDSGPVEQMSSTSATPHIAEAGTLTIRPPAAEVQSPPAEAPLKFASSDAPPAESQDDLPADPPSGPPAAAPVAAFDDGA